MQAACERGLLQAHASRTRPDARPATETILHILAAAKAVEADLAAAWARVQATALRHLLKTLVSASDPGLPKLWA